uniref:Uncharacterized protein n=1 Tax=Hyaloperonospora arabidopsidis (strain Emoy2) TaxID=559515 RepID=M4BD84_HYAAE
MVQVFRELQGRNLDRGSKWPAGTKTRTYLNLTISANQKPRQVLITIHAACQRYLLQRADSRRQFLVFGIRTIYWTSKLNLFLQGCWD